MAILNARTFNEYVKRCVQLYTEISRKPNYVNWFNLY